MGLNHGSDVRADGLVREFERGSKAVDGLDLHIESGEVYGFLGPNGAGKSTTVLMLTTLLPPTGGRATVGGLDVVSDAHAVRRVIGAALQEVALDPMLTPHEHMRLQAALHGLPRLERARRGDELLGRFDLADVAGRKVSTFSGGMKRRLDLALALVHRPSVLFLDEPTTGLDIRSRNTLWDEVRSLAKDEGVTVFLTTQHLEEADVLADRVGIIDHGRIVAEGRPAALKAEIGHPTVEITPLGAEDSARVAATLASFGEPVPARGGGVAVRLVDGEPALAEVIRTLDARGLGIAHLSLVAPSLDDVFLASTGRPLEAVADAGTVERQPAAEVAA
jgi:ABC-2 type transport system ATP-binding protein